MTPTTGDHGSDQGKIAHNTNRTIATSSTFQHEAADHNCWGHVISKKQPHTIRLLLQYVGGIDLKPEGLVKLATLHSFMQEVQVDIAALTECNVAWSLVDQEQYPLEQTKFWWENAHWLITHNRQEPRAPQHQ